MERKTFQAFMTKVDEDQGIVEPVFAVFGNVDSGQDRLWPNSFVKTFLERGGKVRVLDAHNTDSVLRALGKPLAFRELGRDELPADLLARHPDATGGAWAKLQFNMKTQAGHDAFQHVKAGDVTEWSFGYDALDVDYTKELHEGKEVTVRNLRTVRLYEVSPVLFGMNSATTTASAKDAKPAPDVTENTIRIRVRDPGDFQDDSFRTITIGDKGDGIQATIGKLKGEDSTTVQSYVFSREKWTPARAQSWVDDHGKDFDPDATEKALTEEDAPELVPTEEGQSYNCECIECGYKDTSTEHCADRKCPKCGGQMRRAERPGAGQSSRDVEGEQKDETADKATDAPDETKYGRAISGRNAEQMITFVVGIANILEASGYDIPGYDKVPAAIEPPAQEEQGKSADPGAETVTDAPVTEEPQDANQDQQDDEKRAGPSEEAPTPDEGAGPPEGETPTQQVRELALIQIARARLNLLEV